MSTDKKAARAAADGANGKRPVATRPLVPEGGAADPARELLKSYRQLSLEILAEIDLDLGDEYRRGLEQVRGKVYEADSTKGLLALAGEIRRMVGLFVQETFDERNQAAAFAGMIMQRLGEVEKYLLASVGQTVQNHKARESFTTDMINGLDAVETSVKEMKELDELKVLVLDKLDSFKDSLHSQRQAERRQLREMKAKLDDLNGNLRDTKEQMASLEEEKRLLAQKANLDPLTGVLNRRALEDSLEAELGRFRRYGNAFSVLLIDLDHFKMVNDAFGHAGGDVCLKEVTRVLGYNLRSVDVLTRYGGEEFVVILPETGMGQASTVAEKLRQVVEDLAAEYNGRSIRVTVSLGVTQVRPDDEDIAEILDRADKAMYEAKTLGRNQVVTED